jgi:hypothetical protein
MNKPVLCFISSASFPTSFKNNRLIRPGPQVVLDWKQSISTSGTLAK